MDDEKDLRRIAELEQLLAAMLKAHQCPCATCQAALEALTPN